MITNVKGVFKEFDASIYTTGKIYDLRDRFLDESGIS